VRLRAEQQQQLGYARALVASAEGLLSVLQPADSTARQVAPRPAMSAAVAALLAAIAVYALLLLRAAFNTRLRGSEDIAQVTGLQVLAEFPTVGRQEFDRLREPSSYLRTNLLFATEEAHPRVFMVTSSVAGEGKTTVARHLAEGFVRYGYRTLLVDADLRAPTVADGYDIVGSVPEAATTESWLSDAGGTHHILTVTLDDDGQLDVIPQFKQCRPRARAVGTRLPPRPRPLAGLRRRGDRHGARAGRRRPAHDRAALHRHRVRGRPPQGGPPQAGGRHRLAAAGRRAGPRGRCQQRRAGGERRRLRIALRRARGGATPRQRSGHDGAGGGDPLGRRGADGLAGPGGALTASR
jgi:hypothetical protein